MYRVLAAQDLAPGVRRLSVVAPRVARAQRPGQFVIVRVHEHGERIPLTLADADPERGTIELVVQGVGKTTRLINSLEAGAVLRDVAGPLGEPSQIALFGTVVAVAGGVGAAIVWPVARAFFRAGNRVLVLLGARSRELTILEPELRAASHELYVSTDDGSYGEHGLVTGRLAAWLEAGRRIDRVLAVGPVPMMRAVAELTRPHAIPTLASLNSVMLDGTGMCGGCRVSVGGRSRFACVEGPEFDAHAVDFAALSQRNAMYRENERLALEAFLRDPQRDLEALREQGRCAALAAAGAERA